MASKTSETHPIRVDWIDAELVPSGAALGMTFAPGKVDPHSLAGPWHRSLALDLDRLVSHERATSLVSILEPHELERLQISELGPAVRALGLDWIPLHVVDGSVPDPAGELAWFTALRRVLAKLDAGERVVVHCMGGLGRTGTFVAAALTALGLVPDQAIAACRRVRPGAVENPTQVAFVSRARQWWRADLEQRYVGCLLGGAIGDALGAPVEFMSLAAIRKLHGPAGVRELGHHYGGVGRFTDDTQMTLFTAEGLLRATDSDDPIAAVEHALWRWLWTQAERVPTRLVAYADGWLFAEPGLHARRAPGNTCLSALEARVQARLEGSTLPSPLNNSKGCGAVMRAAPAGMIGGDAWWLGCETGRLTHEHPSGWDSAGLLAEMIAEILIGHELRAATTRVWARRRADCHLDTQRAIDAAFALLDSGVQPTAELIETLGGGWVGEEALAIGLYCALVTDDVELALALAVSHSGDSDSTGAIAGNLIGAARGEGVWPAHWREPLEFADGITTIARDLCARRLDGTVDRSRYPSSVPSR